jgi:hypothetical protein
MIEDERLAYRRKVTHCVDKVSDLEHEYHTALVRLQKAEPAAKQRAQVQKYYEEVMEKEIWKNLKAVPVFRKKNRDGQSPRYAFSTVRCLFRGAFGFPKNFHVPFGDLRKRANNVWSFTPVSNSSITPSSDSN